MATYIAHFVRHYKQGGDGPANPRPIETQKIPYRFEAANDDEANALARQEQNRLEMDYQSRSIILERLCEERNVTIKPRAMVQRPEPAQ